MTEGGAIIEPMTMTVNQRRRMAHVRYLHQLGIDQAKLPDPQASVSVLLLHDAVESFLALVGDHVGVAPREFEKYWPEIKKNLPGETGLPLQAGMFRLNKVRVALKHYGAQPNLETIEQLVVDTATFLAASTQLVFDADYSSITMVDLIGQDLPHQLAHEAEAAMTNGDITTGMKRLREAFDQLFAAHLPVSVGLRRSDFSFGPMQRELSFFPRTGTDLDDVVKRLVEAVHPIQEGMRLVSLGLDYSEFLRFDRLTPQYSSNYRGGIRWTAPQGYAPDQEAFDFCMQFVVKAALRLAAAEARAADPAWTRRDQYGRFEEVSLGDESAVENRYAATPDEINF